MPDAAKPAGGFRFYDNRQKYLMFVNTCSEKWVDRRAHRATSSRRSTPQPPALRFFDAGIGDGTVLARVMRTMHQRFARIPFYVAGKEISLEDIRLHLDKMPDRLSRASRDGPRADQHALCRRAVAVAGRDATPKAGVEGSAADGHDHRRVRTRRSRSCKPFLDANWRTRAEPRDRAAAARNARPCWCSTARTAGSSSTT